MSPLQLHYFSWSGAPDIKFCFSVSLQNDPELCVGLD